MNILLLEDNFDAAKIKDFLESQKYTVYRAKNIIEAEDLLESDVYFDIAIIDLDMDKRYLEPELLSGAEDQYAGWIFCRHYLFKDPKPIKKIIILSALAKHFKETVSSKEVEGITIINKQDVNNLEQVCVALKSI